MGGMCCPNAGKRLPGMADSANHGITEDPPHLICGVGSTFMRYFSDRELGGERSTIGPSQAPKSAPSAPGLSALFGRAPSY